MSIKGNDIANYKTVVIGEQVWMAENLDYNVSGSVCNGNNNANCNKYGRLYTWATAMALPSSCNYSNCASQINAQHQGICPSGWHIPSEDDWNTLTVFAGGASKYFGEVDSAAIKLRAKSGWICYGCNDQNGQDTYGFAALPGGFHRNRTSGDFISPGMDGYWWSASESGADAGYWIQSSSGSDYYYYIYTNYGYDDKRMSMSVRCVKDKIIE